MMRWEVVTFEKITERIGPERWTDGPLAKKKNSIVLWISDVIIFFGGTQIELTDVACKR